MTGRFSISALYSTGNQRKRSDGEICMAGLMAPRLTEPVSCEICIYIYKLCPSKVPSTPIFLSVKMSCNERIRDIDAEHLSISNCKCYKILSKFAIHRVYHQRTNTFHMTVIYLILKHVSNYLPTVIKETKI